MVTILPLESKKAQENLEEMLSVKGLDLISLSMLDLPQSMGYGREYDHPEVMKARDRAYELATKKGVRCYFYAHRLNDPRFRKCAEHYYEMGVRTFIGGHDIGFLMPTAANRMKELREWERKLTHK